MITFYGMLVVHVMCKLFGYLWLSEITWTVAHQTLLSMEFTRQEYWSGLSFPPGRLSDPGIKHESPALPVDSLPSEPPILLIEQRFIFYADNFTHLMTDSTSNRPASWSVIISIASLSLPTWLQGQLLKNIFILWYELWTCNFGSCYLHWHNSNIPGSYFYIRLTSTNIIEMKLTINLKSIFY